ncbi:toprim domain-containing protein [Fusobacterium animalis]|uniref:toprim domain-containing protein n=1 Tax=Fusobacterium animalis TaxID=76859 RepID=UPI0034DEBF14
MAFVGVKYNSFNQKLIEVHKLDEEILAKYGIAVDIEDDECFNCGAEKLNFFYSKTNKEGVERGYLKCKCFSCNFTGDVLDIVKVVDPNLKNSKPGAIVEYLLSEEFQKKPNIIDTNREYTGVKKVRKKDKKEKPITDYIKYINMWYGNLKIRLIEKNEEITSYLYKRGFNQDDFKYMYGYLGLEDWTNEDTGKNYQNFIFPCSDYSFIRRLIKEYYTKKGKLLRYMNSISLPKTEHYCYLLEMVTVNRIIKNNFFNIYICEGTFDTLTVRILFKNQCLCFATGGAGSNHNLIVTRLKKVAKEVFLKSGKKLNIITMFDVDTVGEKGKDNLAELLKDDCIRVYKNFSKMILKNGKDLNEELQINRSELENNLYIIDNNLKEL